MRHLLAGLIFGLEVGLTILAFVLQPDKLNDRLDAVRCGLVGHTPDKDPLVMNGKVLEHCARCFARIDEV